MRVLLSLTLSLLTVASGVARAAPGDGDDDDPKRGRRRPPVAQPRAEVPAQAPAAPNRPAEPPPPSVLLVGGEDDPKLQRLAGVKNRGPAAREHSAPTFKLAYRRLIVPHLDHTDLTFNVVEIDLYPVSMRWLRVALDAELGFGSGVLEGKPSTAWFLTSGVNIGFQYPWRVTPFVDFRVVGGLIGGDVADETAITWCYMLGIDSGVEVYIVDRLYVSAAIGWVRATYNGVDLPYARAHKTEDPKPLQFSGDSFTFKIGIGL